MPTRLAPSLLRSRFGRRLLLLFVLCSLIPALALAWLSFGTVSRQLRRASLERLQHADSLVGAAIAERLVFLQQDFRRVAARLTPCPAGREPGEGPLCDGLIDYGLAAVTHVPAAGEPVHLVGRIDPVPALDGAQRSALAAGRDVAFDRVVGERHLVYLARATAAAGILIGQLDPLFLWGSPDQPPLVPSMQFHVVNPEGRLISRTTTGGDRAPPATWPAGGRGVSGTTDWNIDRVPYVAAFAPIPEPDEVAIPAWTLVVSEARAAVVAPMAAFRRTFPLIIAAAFGAAILLSLVQLRRSLAPLRALQAGTQRLAARRFEEPVVVASRDEFADLAASFNAMGDQLQRQFAALATSAEIDRAVLSSIETKWIVRTVLERMRDLCPSDLVAVSLLDPAGGDETTTWVQAPDTAAGMAAATAPMEPAERDRLTHGPDRILMPVTGAPAFLAPLVRRRATALLLLPLRYQNRLVGMITLGAHAASPWSEDDLVQAERVAGQIALALTNARMVEQIRLLAFHDGLTGLPNRVSFKRRLGEELDRAREEDAILAVLLLDIDHFNRINDTLGHKVGDRLVQEVGARIRTCCLAAAPAAEVARLGGDEFTVLLPRIAGPEAAEALALSIRHAFTAPVSFADHEMVVSTSIGISLHPVDGRDIENLLKNADVAMYQAKLKGRNRHEFYADSMSAHAARRLALEGQLRKALELGQFTMVYQPVVELATGRVTSAEALIRWHHPEWGQIPPAEFIPVCEQSGLIVAVGDWTLRTVCEQQRAWQQEGLRTIPVAINLSGEQLRGDAIVETVRHALEQSGLDPKLLTIELTESILMQSKGDAAAVLHALAAQGVGLAIDDFGTGYSSLAYIKHFPVNTLKIDRSFVQDVTTNPDDAAITKAVIAMGGALGLKVIAEGVELDEQVDFLRREGCDAIQGYLVSRPVDPAGFSAWIRGDGIVEAMRPDARRSVRKHG